MATMAKLVATGFMSKVHIAVDSKTLCGLKVDGRWVDRPDAKVGEGVCANCQRAVKEADEFEFEQPEPVVEQTVDEPFAPTVPETSHALEHAKALMGAQEMPPAQGIIGEGQDVPDSDTGHAEVGQEPTQKAKKYALPEGFEKVRAEYPCCGGTAKMRFPIGDDALTVEKVCPKCGAKFAFRRGVEGVTAERLADTVAA